MRPPDWEDWAAAAETTVRRPPGVTRTDVGGLELLGGDQRGPARQWCPWSSGTAEALRRGQGRVCHRTAGSGTDHLGAGYCSDHGGRGRRKSMMGAMAMAHAYARERNVTPWEALLGEVRRCAGAVAWLDGKVGEAPEDDDLLPGGSHAEWVRMRERERDRLARTAKMAMDAGVAERLVAQVELQGAAIARVVMATVSSLGLDDEQMTLARAELRRQLLALESGDDASYVVEGEVL